MNEEVRQTTPPDDEMSEYWERLPSDDDGLRRVEAFTGPMLEGYWQVTIFAQEFFRQDPLGLELRQRLQAAFRALPGVTDALEQDTETWLISGLPSGEDLCRVAANILDEMADRMRSALSDEG